MPESSSLPAATTRLNKRMAELGLCSRREADDWIARGWVRVDGQLAVMGLQVGADARIDVDTKARGQQQRQVTILLHKPVGYDAIKGRKAAAGLVQPETRWPDDPSGVRLLDRHFHRLTPLVPLDPDASGLMVLTQDGRVWRRLTEDRDEIEQEFVVEVSGQIVPYGLARLNHGLHYGGRPLRPCKVSWQNEIRLRFALKGVQGGQLRDMCAQVGLQVVAIRRIRIGKVPLAKMPVGMWRYLPVGERF